MADKTYIYDYLNSTPVCLLQDACFVAELIKLIQTTCVSCQDGNDGNDGNDGGGSSSTPNLQQVLTQGNTSIKSIILNGEEALQMDGISRFSKDIYITNTDIPGFDIPTRVLTTDSNGKLVFVDVNNLITDGDGNPLTPTFTSDISVKLNNENIGKYHNGQTIPSLGKTAEQVIKDIAQDSIPAVGTLSASPIPTSTEVGTVISITFTGTYIQNDGAPLTTTNLKRNSTSINLALPYTDTNVTIDKTPKAYQSVYNSATFSNTITYVGLYKYFAGPVTVNPTTSTEVRALASVFENQAFILNTGSTATKFAFWVPNTKSISHVIDLDALNLDITNEYTQSSLSILDGGGNTIAGKLFIKDQTVPYSSNHRHQITVI